MEVNSNLQDIEMSNDGIEKDKLKFNALIVYTIIMISILFVSYFLEIKNAPFFVFINIAIFVCIFRMALIAKKCFKIIENA